MHFSLFEYNFVYLLFEYRTKRYLKYQTIHILLCQLRAIFSEPGFTTWQAIPFKRKFYFSVEYGTKRQFSVDWLEKYDWLRYSVSENSVYYAPCILFGASFPKEKTFINTPVSKWSTLGKYIKRHTEPGSSHHSCCASASSFMNIIEGKQASITAQLSRNKVETVAKNRQVLRSVIEVIILCGRQNIPLKGHDDNKSNFTILLKDKANRDEILKTHLSSKSKVTYTSPMIQNE